MKATSLIYKEENRASFGVLKDRQRIDDDVYEFGTLDYTYTLSARTDKIAFAAITIVAPNEPITIFQPLTCLPYPNNLTDFEAMYGDYKTFLFFVEGYFAEVVTAMRSIYAGGRSQRKTITEVFGAVPNSRSSNNLREYWHRVQKRKHCKGADLRKKAGELAHKLSCNRKSDETEHPDGFKNMLIEFDMRMDGIKFI